MQTITKEFRFEAAHRLQHHNGACRNVHGHSYRVEVSLRGPVHTTGSATACPFTGMVMDFSGLTRVMRRILDTGVGMNLPWDHGLFIQKDDPIMASVAHSLIDAGLNVHMVEWEPTAENMAAVLAASVQCLMDQEAELDPKIFPVNVVRVTVWETSKARACWQAGDRSLFWGANVELEENADE